VPTAAYDEIADWYAVYVADGAAGFSSRVKGLLRELLSRPVSGTSRCLDIGCGTGVRAEAIRELGWLPVGVDLSQGQLRHAKRVLPVVQAEATALPLASGSVDAVTCILCHTDVPDYAAVVAEAARVLKPGGLFVHIGVHPSFTGAFADRADPARIVVDSGYHRRERRFDSFTQLGVRAKVGAWHVPLDALFHTALDAGLQVTKVIESAPEDCVPDMLGFGAVKPGFVGGSR
jgi:ubiquinone/menaquinone biosynthesis C-methylase UbiE